MSRSFREAEADRCLSRWAWNITKGYTNLGVAKVNLDGSGGRSTVEEDYTPQEARCLFEMEKVKKDDIKMYNAARAEYVKQAIWFAECRSNRGWRDRHTHVFHKVSEPKKEDFLKFVRAEYGMASSDYYDRLRRLRKRIAREVI